MATSRVIRLSSRKDFTDTELGYFSKFYDGVAGEETYLHDGDIFLTWNGHPYWIENMTDFFNEHCHDGDILEIMTVRCFIDTFVYDEDKKLLRFIGSRNAPSYECPADNDRWISVGRFRSTKIM